MKFINKQELAKIIKRNEKGRFVKTNRINLDRNELYDLYINKKMSTRKIAKLKGCSFSLIIERLKEFDIPTRKIKYDCLKGKLPERYGYKYSEDNKIIMETKDVTN